MDYPFGPKNFICRNFGHRYGPQYSALGRTRRTCSLCGTCTLPFARVPQLRETAARWAERYTALSWQEALDDGTMTAREQADILDEMGDKVLTSHKIR